ncbi:glycosyltransferase [Marinobacter sp.]|uniref:glycosyltransferase n=1 Tax=Marinobacter sp. TaxID=50741 RepID=UPI00257BF48B|nr:glycosyltransferase [Marinobacter sp.]
MQTKREGGRRIAEPGNRKFQITVITICYNDLKGLQLTVESVKRNLSDGLEYIIIDGASSDGSADFIQTLDFVDYWVSEPDDGIYDAMNKGAALSRGQGLIFLNAGDYVDGSIPLGRLNVPCFLPVWYQDPLGRFRKISVKPATRGMPNCHQGVVFENKGLRYDSRYQIAADFDYFLQHGYDHRLPMAPVGGRVVFDSSGVSSTRLLERDREIESIIHQYFGRWQSLRFRWRAFAKRMVKAVINGVKN